MLFGRNAAIRTLTATDVAVAWSVCWAKTDEPIEMLFVGRLTGCTLAPHGEYHYTISALRRCVPFSNYFHHLPVKALYFINASDRVLMDRRQLMNINEPARPRPLLPGNGQMADND